MGEKEAERSEELLGIRALLSFRAVEKMIKIEGLSFLQQFELTRTQYAALEMLYLSGNMTIENLRKAIFETHGNITVVVRNLERDQYILKTRSEKDRRCVLLSLTEKGKKKMDKIMPLVKAHFQDLTSCLDDKDLEELYRVCIKFRLGLEDRVSRIMEED